MPQRKKGETRQALLRQWTILSLLPPRPASITAAEIQRRLEQSDEAVRATKRTVERDLTMLSDVFPLECRDEGSTYRWSRPKNVEICLPAPTPAQALALVMVQRFLQPMLPQSVLASLAPLFDVAGATLERLAAVTPDARWPERIRVVPPTQPLIPPEIEPEVQAEMMEAILHGSQVSVLYRSAGHKRAREMVLHPLGLVLRGPVTYVVATVEGYDDVRLFVLHRIEAAERLQRKAETPEEFSLDDYLAKGMLDFSSTGEKIRLVALFDADAAAHLRETRLCSDQTMVEEPDGRIRVIATVNDTLQLRWWLRGFGITAEIVEPRKLREEFEQHATQLSSQYLIVQ